MRLMDLPAFICSGLTDLGVYFLYNFQFSSDAQSVTFEAFVNLFVTSRHIVCIQIKCRCVCD